MAINITIDGTDRSSIITKSSVQKSDNINEQVDTLSFVIEYSSGQTFRPTANSVVIMTDNLTGSTVRTFGGRISSVAAETEGLGHITYSVTCQDYSYDLGRQLVNETYEAMTVNAIISAILVSYTDGTFTTANVNCPTILTKHSFQRVTVIQALQNLADLTGYSWYVDYNKDVHFFAANTERAPFNSLDYDGNVITESLKFSEDFTQIRNRVYIQGGEIEGASRSESFNGDGVKLQFKFSNKFAKTPTVTVGGVAKTVGVDFLDNDADFDCFWDFNNQYVRFKASTVPPLSTNNIIVTGIPLYTLVVQAEEPISISQYGVFEFAKTDVTIKSRESAVGLAKSELAAYCNGVVEASFDTYIPGLRSGQIITMTSTLFGVDEDYVIQSTQFGIINDTKGYWTVKLATVRTVNLVLFLLNLLNLPGTLIDTTGEVVIEKTVFPLETIGVSDSVAINTDDYPQTETIGVHDTTWVQALNFNTIFVAGPYIPDPTNASDTKRVFLLNSSSVLG